MSHTYQIQFVSPGDPPRLVSETFRAENETEARRQGITIMRARGSQGGKLVIRIDPVGDAPEFWTDVGRVNAGR